MSNSLSKFYYEQAGSGIDLYSGYYSNQRGRGLFGDFFNNQIKPVLTSFVPILKDTAIHGAQRAIDHASQALKSAKRKRRVTSVKRKNKRKPVARKESKTTYF